MQEQSLLEGYEHAMTFAAVAKQEDVRPAFSYFGQELCVVFYRFPIHFLNNGTRSHSGFVRGTAFDDFGYDNARNRRRDVQLPPDLRRETAYSHSHWGLIAFQRCGGALM